MSCDKQFIAKICIIIAMLIIENRISSFETEEICIVIIYKNKVDQAPFGTHRMVKKH